MRRTEIIAAARSVDRLLDETGIAPLAASAPALAGGGDGLALADRIFDLYGQVTAATSRLTAAERHVLQCFGLATVLERGWWRQAMSEAASGRAGGLHALNLAIRTFRQSLPILSALIAPSALADRAAEAAAPQDSLVLLLIEDAQQRSTPERLVAALSSTSTFYRVAARLAGRDEGDLTVLNCDSGGDKSIELAGLAEVIAAVRDIILSIYRRAAAHADLAGPARLERIRADLPVFGHLPGLGAEQAELFRRSLSQAIEDFVAAGTIIPEMLDIAGPAARRVMAPERKLLAQPAGGAAADTGLEDLRQMLLALRRERDELVASLPPESRESLYRRLAAEGLA